MTVQRDRLRWSVILVGCSILGALSACVNMDAEPPESPPTPSPPPKPRFDAQVVTVDGVQYWEHQYLDKRIRVPLSDGRVSFSELNPSWIFRLPDDLPTQPPAKGYRVVEGDGYVVWFVPDPNAGPLDPKGYSVSVEMGLRLLDTRPEPVDTSELRMKTVEQLSSPPDETHARWDLVFYRSEYWRPDAIGNEGYWIPADSTFRSRDDRRLVIRCVGQLKDIERARDRMRCFFDVEISDRMTARVNFGGTFLPDWKRIYDLAMTTIEQRVYPLDEYSAPNP